MNVPVTRTKIIVPRRRADLLSRPRLTDMLIDLLDKKVVILAAPAGYGKTSSLVDLTQQTNIPFCWYSIDSLDQDFLRFVTYFIASINQRFPAFGVRSSQMLQSLQTNNVDLYQLVTTIVNEAYDTIQEHFAIVLDDYHLIDTQAEINNFLSLFVQSVDENCHVIIASRTLLSLPDLPLMVARSQVGGFGFEELAFQTEEVRSLLQQNYHLSISEAAANQIVTQTEGWITGLLLSTQTKFHDLPDRSRLARVSSVGLYEYLAQQVLDQQPPEIRDFLLQTSYLEEFDAELCEAVLGPARHPGPSWGEMMETILRNNLFVLPIGEKGLWLRYHHLFRDFLQNRLQTQKPDEAIRVQTRLAETYTLRSEWERAYDIYQRLRNQDRVVALIEIAGSSLIKSGRLATLSSWIDNLPQDHIANRPILLSLRGGAAVMLGEVERGLALLNHSEGMLRQSENILELIQVLDRRAHAYRFLGDGQAALRDIEEALTLCEGRSEMAELKASVMRTRGLVISRMGDHKTAIESLKSAESLYDALGMDERVAITRIDLGTIHYFQGNFDQSRFAYEDALEYLKKSGDLARQATVLNNLGVLHHNLGDFLKAISYLEQAILCGTQSGYARMEALSLASIGDLYIDLDAPDAALEAYQRAYEIASRIQERNLTFYLTLAQSVAYRKIGEVDNAQKWIIRAEALSEDSKSYYEQALCLLERGKHYLLQSNSEKAIDCWGKAVNLLDISQQPVESIQTKLFLANAYRLAHDDSKASDILLAANIEAPKFEENQKLISAAREVIDLIRFGLADPRLVDSSKKLLAKIETLETVIPSVRRRIRRAVSTIPFAQAKLTIRGLGKIQVLVDGSMITSVKWQAQVARDLLFLLLSHPEGLTKEAIASIFWPESNQNQVKLQFKNTIYRMRHALGLDAIVLDDEHYMFNRSLDYEYDAESFTSKIAQAQSAATPEKKIAFYKSAIHIYKGTYLPDVEGVWAWNERQRLDQVYTKALLHLADLYIQVGEYDQCLEVCRVAIAKDACLEEAHRLAMRAHAGLGNKADVVRQYETCEQTLQREVHLPPSTQTRSLYEQLVR